MKPDDAQGFITEIRERDGAEAWIIGDVKQGKKKALFTQQVTVIDV